MVNPGREDFAGWPDYVCQLKSVATRIIGHCCSGEVDGWKFFPFWSISNVAIVFLLLKSIKCCELSNWYVLFVDSVYQKYLRQALKGAPMGPVRIGLSKPSVQANFFRKLVEVELVVPIRRRGQAAASPLAQPAQLRQICRRTRRPSPAPVSALKPFPQHQVSLQVSSDIFFHSLVSTPVCAAGALSSGLTGRGPLSPAIGCPVLPQVTDLD